MLFNRNLIMLLMAMNACGLKGGDELSCYGSAEAGDDYYTALREKTQLECEGRSVPVDIMAKYNEQELLRLQRERAREERYKIEQEAKAEAERGAKFAEQAKLLYAERRAAHRARRMSRKSTESSATGSPIAPVKK